jgi:hypothetical protein
MRRVFVTELESAPGFRRCLGGAEKQVFADTRHQLFDAQQRLAGLLFQCESQIARCLLGRFQQGVAAVGDFGQDQGIECQNDQYCRQENAVIGFPAATEQRFLARTKQ